jgi:hypothetical protein
VIRPEPKVVKLMATIVRQHPDFLEWLEEWRMRELEYLPQAAINTALMQGRCQVLGELYKFAKDAPELAAKSSQNSPSNHAHR